METLNQCQKNSEFLIKDFQGSETFKSRLIQIGIHIGKHVQVIGRAPFQGPLLVRVGDMVFALRPEEAECVLVARDS